MALDFLGVLPFLQGTSLVSAYLLSLYGVCHKGLRKETAMPNIVLVILIVLLVGVLPTWPYSSGWGYYPSGGLGVLLLIVLVLALSGRRGALKV